MKRRMFLSLVCSVPITGSTTAEVSEDRLMASDATVASCADYSALREYAGSAGSIYVTGLHVGRTRSGIAGIFTRSDGDRSTADNGGTVIVGRNGVRWKRMYRGPVNPLWFSPIDRNSTTDDGAAIRAALAVGSTQLPEERFNVQSTIVLPTRRRLTGLGVDQSVINSNIPHGPLFSAVNSGASFGYLAHMRLNGNGILGAGGSGHCFSFIDPEPHAGSATPQNFQLEHLWIDGFLGTGDSDDTGGQRIWSAGVMQYGTLAVTCRHVYVSDCGNGFYVRRTQNCRIVDSVVTGMRKAGVFAYDNENLLVDACDLVNCGLDMGKTDPGYPVRDNDLMGVFVSYLNNNLTLSNSKLKGFKGKALIVVKGDGQNINIRSNWIRGDAQWDAPHKAIYAEGVSGLVIRDNLFTPSNTGFSASRKYETIELFCRSEAPAFHSTIEGNTFLDPSGFGVAYNIALRGDGRACTHRATIRNNRFGSNRKRAAPCVVDADILLSNSLLDSCYLGENSHVAAKSVTRASGIAARNVAIRKCRIGPNHFQAAGGAIMQNYSGLSESVVVVMTPWTGSSRIPGEASRSQEVRIGELEANDFVEADLLPPTAGVLVTAQVRKEGSVNIEVLNRSGVPVNVSGRTVRVRITKQWSL